MPQTEHYDALVLGSGEGGKFIAWHLGRSGQRVAVVERRWIGGSCPNINCLPSKNEIWSAKVADLAHHGARYGSMTGPITTDMARVRARKREMVNGLIERHLKAYKASGAELIMGSGRFTAPKTLEVTLNAGGTRLLASERVFLNLGTHPAMPEVPRLADAQPMTNIETLELDHLPAHLIVLGGSYVGLELGQAYRRFGSEVTIIEHGPQIMGREDPDVVTEIQRVLSEEGIRFVTAAEIAHVEGRSGKQIRLRLRSGAGEEIVEGSDMLVAIGRVPNTAGIGLELTGVELDNRGYIKVNDRLETSATGVWAIGECAGSPQFTHVSYDDYRVIQANLNGGGRSTKGRLVPYCMFTDPQLARVGLSESEAQRQGVAVRVAKMPMSDHLRAQTIGETQGFLKALVGKDDDRILGFTMVGSEAGEVMATVQTAMLAGLPYTALRDAILAHPTMTEGLTDLFSRVPAR
ncbi:MAG TPA: mercuric reductase [Dongiaceae bacterium]|nr:mercuric reductase [Dongiaceae bacterium]